MRAAGTGAFPASYTTVATLPAGARPLGGVLRASGGAYASATANGVYVQITTGGEIQPFGVGASSDAFYSQGISFMVS